MLELTQKVFSLKCNFEFCSFISYFKTSIGYIGYLPSNKTIYVVFRGSKSIRNWLTNVDTVTTEYKSYPECNCRVHKGFYDAEQRIIAEVLTEVKKLKKMFELSSYAIQTTGHSLGAALALLTALGFSLKLIICKLLNDHKSI